MGGGLIQVFANDGPQDLHLTGNPDITFFKVFFFIISFSELFQLFYCLCKMLRTTILQIISINRRNNYMPQI